LHRVKALLLKPAALGALFGMAFVGAGLIFGSFAFAKGVAAGTASSVCGSPPTTSAILTSAQMAGVASSGTDGSPTTSTSPTAPSTPLNLVASAGNAQVTGSWSVPASDGGSPITGYDVYRGTSSAGESATPIATNVSSTSFTDTGLTNGTTYYYTVAAINAVGESPQSAEASATPQAVAPSAPTGLMASGGNGQVALSWAVPASDGGSPITGYNVYRGTSPGGESTTAVATNVLSSSFTDTGVTNGATYYYTVAAVNAVGLSLQSAEASATPQAVAPSAPQALTVTGGNDVATLSWSPPASDGGATVTGYDVYRGTTSGGESATPIATNVSGTTFTDTGLTNGTTYYYTVAAINAVGASPQSAEASATPSVAQLCVMVQTYPSATTTVTAGDTASFIVWVWSTGATSTNVSVLASITAASYLSTPSFSICPSASGATCNIASLPVGQVYELLVSVPVSAAAPDAASVAFTAAASATGALPFSASATEAVAATSSAVLPSSSTAEPPLIELPSIPGTDVTPVNPSQLFPTVSPSPGSGNLRLPGARSRSAVHAAEVSSTVPIDARLIGAQLVGLAVLAGAVTIAIVRMSLRRRLPTPAAPATPASPAAAGDPGKD
jgi:fibronectin type 3 domain-containing protein